MQTIGKIYSIIGTLFLTTVLMILAILFSIDALIAEPEIESADGTVTRYVGRLYSSSFDLDSYHYVNKETAKEIGQDYDVYSVSGHWQVSGWTLLTNREFSSKHLNITDKGLRHTVAPDERYNEQPPFVIWTFGGSTMFGWGMSDGYTLPSLLQVDLQERLLDYQVQVLNFGVPSYTSAQELALFMDNVRDGEHPNLVLFLNGLNDPVHIVRRGTNTPLEPEVELAWENWIKELVGSSTDPWLSVGRSFPLFKIFPPNLSIRQTIEFDEVESDDELLEHAYEAVEHYLFNLDVMIYIAETYDIPAYFFLQPLRVNLENLSYFSIFYNEVPERVTHPNFYDISDALWVFASESESFVDNGHYSDKGNEILAEIIAEIILQDIAP